MVCGKCRPARPAPVGARQREGARLLRRYRSGAVRGPVIPGRNRRSGTCPKAMSKMARGCGHFPKQHPAILPWPSSLLMTGTPIRVRHVPAAPGGRILDGGCDMTPSAEKKAQDARVPRKSMSTANAELVDQILVAAFVGTLE